MRVVEVLQQLLEVLCAHVILLPSYVGNVDPSHEVALTLRALAPPLLAERRDPERRGHDQHGRGEDRPLDPVTGVRNGGHACPAADRIHRPMEVKTTITPSIHSCDRTAVPVSG